MTTDRRKLALKRIFSLLWPSDANRASHGEKWISAFGGFIGILAVLWISHGVLDLQGAAMVVGSMGASAVLLFAVPHGALSQPWPVFGGHLISAFVGVSCAQHIADPMLAGALAVGLSIGAMYYLHCLHPPGGATALVAVLGGEAVQELGYTFIFSPVLENVLIILAMAVVLNLPFRQRRFPPGLARPAEVKEAMGEKALIAHSDLVYALSQLDSFIDVSEEDLIRIYTLAVHHTHDPVRCHLEGEVCGDEHTDCLCRQLSCAEG
ncbi:MAG: HPP family protein [Gammaproteobacteria bacterium]|nr:HPP family protein [Gammaproteobacteria bacterium]